MARRRYNAKRYRYEPIRVTRYEQSKQNPNVWEIDGFWLVDASPVSDAGPGFWNSWQKLHAFDPAWIKRELKAMNMQLMRIQAGCINLKNALQFNGADLKEIRYSVAID